MMIWKGIATTAAIVLGLCMTAVAQQQSNAPSEALRPYVVLSGQSLGALEQRLRPGNKLEELIGGQGMQLRVVVQHEENQAGASAELHDNSDDVYYILEGTALLTLGGRLDAPREAEPGEWRSPRIIDGKTFEVRKGDLIVVPRGTPHQRSTAGRAFSMLLIKVFARPMGKPK